MSGLDAQLQALAGKFPAVRKARLAESIAAHHRVTSSDPAILIGALVEWCADGCTLPRQYWDRVDDVSNRVKARYRAREESRDTDL
jgi:hypothetical protein